MTNRKEVRELITGMIRESNRLLRNMQFYDNKKLARKVQFFADTLREHAETLENHK